MSVLSFIRAAGIAMALAGTALDAAAQTDAPAERRYAFVSHAPDSDAWWNTIRNALTHASEDFGLVRYKHLPLITVNSGTQQQSERMARYGISLKPAEAHINSGPGFVTKLNVEKVERYSGQFR